MRLFRRKDEAGSGGGEVPLPESYEVRRGPDRDEIAQRLWQAAPTKAKVMMDALRPAVRYGVHATPEAEIPLGANKIGGAPHLPPSTPWPEGTRFFAQVDLAGAAAVAPASLALPADGLLSFFADYDDDTGTGKEGIAVYTPAGTPLAPVGDGPDPLPTARLKPVGVWTWPEIELSESEFDAVDAVDLWHEEQIAQAAGAAFITDGRHQIGGHARTINEPVEPDAAWELLFQLDTDDALDVMWGDVGTLYWVIRLGDKAASHFERAAFTTQSAS